MPDSSLPGAKRSRSLTIAAYLDVALGAMGLIAATLLALAITVVVWIIGVAQWASYYSQGHFIVAPEDGGFAGAILAYSVPILVSVFADACLFATGIQLLVRSRNARRSAFLFAAAMVPLGALDFLTAWHFESARWFALPFVVLLPLYSVGQLAAFFVLPSWKRLGLHSEANASPTT